MKGVVVGGNIRCFLKLAGTELPIAVTKDIGHGTDAKAIVIGQEVRL